MFDILILAAGEGKRMGKGPPKVLRELQGMSLIQRIINTVSQLNHTSNNIFVVVKKLLPLSQENITFLKQGPDKGTAKAVEPYLSVDTNSDYVLILAGDTPLITKEILQDFINSFLFWEKQAGIIAFEPDDGKQYGRIIGNKIIEYKDCSEKERETSLCNTGVYIFNRMTLQAYLPLINNNNAQNEYYLTDIFNYNLDTFIYKIHPQDNFKFHGINTLDDLKECEQFLLNKLI
jgi:bifunctional N-acetylglucosamine-1-phosphate-uridyltransferase/glucosamine-1-phosphate-acetyltransferase GlmU-like protein